MIVGRFSTVELTVLLFWYYLPVVFVLVFVKSYHERENKTRGCATGQSYIQYVFVLFCFKKNK